jgi:FAD dependent oxidoreductase TIGR03364
MESYDDAIVGAGILGLAHAYHLSRLGRRVIVFERGPRALQASVRNFGMIWPIGQAPGAAVHLARRSAEIWRELLDAAGLWYAAVGSLHLAYREDEAAVLQEFARAASDLGYPCVRLLTPHGVQTMSDSVLPDGLLAGIYSPTEINVDPRQVIAALPAFLTREYDVRFVWNTTVTGYERPVVYAGETRCRAENLYVCSGADLQTLYPEVFQKLEFRPCKLQMLRAARPAADWQLGPMLAAGLTLQHYAAFAGCPTLPALKARFAKEMPEYNLWGIHVMASQNRLGEIIIGDSHIYGESAYEPFDSDEVDALILHYLDTFLRLPEPRRITTRWNGLYMKHSRDAYVVEQPTLGVTCVTGVGGAGMTLSMGLAEKVVKETMG